MNKYTILSLAVLCLAVLLSPLSTANASDLADPMTIGVGARPLALGKAYVAMAENADTLFVNPAGIASIQEPKATSMYTNLLNDVNYTLIGGAYPLGRKSAVGAGILNASTSDIVLRDSTAAITGSGSWSNTIAFVSYGRYLNDLPAFSNVKKDVLIGGSVKYYSVGGNGSSTISDAASNGFSADLGMLYPASDAVNLGVSFQNALSGLVQNDKIPTTLRIGAKANIIGKEGKSISVQGQRKLYANLDYDLVAAENLAHLGIEFWPSSNLALRAGLDGVNPTAGIGVRVRDVEFNYAYHPYNGMADNNTHFFSIGYLGEPIKRVLHVELDRSADKTVTYTNTLKVAGKVTVTEGSDTNAPQKLSLKINGKEVSLNQDLSFSTEVPLDKFGKNIILVEASDASGLKALTDLKVVRLINFSDVPDSYWARKPIEETGTLGLVNGYPDKTFRPEGTLTRAEMTALLVRAKGLSLASKPKKKFNDVSADFWAAPYIYAASQAGLIKGYSDGSFKPNRQLTKAEAITIMARFEELKTAAVLDKPYWDVNTKHWAAKYIAAAKEAGMLKFADQNQLRPDDSVVRSEAVDMLAKTSIASGKINSLYAWENEPIEKTPAPIAISTKPTLPEDALPTPATISFKTQGEYKTDVILVNEFSKKVKTEKTASIIK